MKRVLLDTNIYGEMVIDPELDIVKVSIANKRAVIIYGNNLIRKELRDTPRNTIISDGNLRIYLLNLYNDVVKQEYDITDEMRSIAESYYKAYKEFGGSKPRIQIIDDFVIVACATIHGLDIVVSEDEKTMLTENAVRAYRLINNVLKKRTPKFLGYREFKNILRGG